VKLRLSKKGREWQEKLHKLGSRTKKDLDFYLSFEYNFSTGDPFDAIYQANRLLPSWKADTPELMCMDHWEFIKDD